MCVCVCTVETVSIYNDVPTAGVVQTAYANGGATDFLKRELVSNMIVMISL